MEINPSIIHYCRYQERCHAEVRNKLFELGLGKNEVEIQLSLLIAANHLNEERFAIAYARGKFRMLGWGKDKIRQQLKVKKISDYCINKALKQLETPDYANKLKNIACKKLSHLKTERNAFVRKNKLYKFLIQKGYQKQEVSAIIAELIQS